MPRVIGSANGLCHRPRPPTPCRPAPAGVRARACPFPPAPPRASCRRADRPARAVGLASPAGGAVLPTPRRKRRAAVASMFLAASAIVVLASEPFAQALVSGGKQQGFHAGL